MKKSQKLKDEIDILLVTDNGIETVGGEQESVKIIINGLKKKYRMGIIQPGNINNPIPRIHYFPLTEYTRIKHFVKNPIIFFGYIWKIRKIINTENPKIIHTQAQVSSFIVALLKKLKLISSRSKLIHTERGLYIRYLPIFKSLFHLFFNELDGFITTTQYNMNYWKKGLKQKKYDTSSNVIENTAGELFEIYDESKEKLGERLVIGFEGRYSEQKDWPLAVEICRRLNNVIPNQFEVWMAVGCLDEKSKVITKRMFLEVQKLLGDDFKGKINIGLQEMDQLYYDTDIFIMTSKPNSESFGRTIVEAMSRNCAVLTTDAGGPVEIIRNKSSICRNAKEFSDKVLELREKNNLLFNEKIENKKYVSTKYSTLNNIKKHKLLYEKYLN